MTGTGTLNLKEAMKNTGAMKKAVTETEAMTEKEAMTWTEHQTDQGQNSEPQSGKGTGTGLMAGGKAETEVMEKTEMQNPPPADAPPRWTGPTGRSSSSTYRTNEGREGCPTLLIHLPPLPDPEADQLSLDLTNHVHVQHPGGTLSMPNHHGLHTWSGPTMEPTHSITARTQDRGNAQPVVLWSLQAFYWLTPVPATPKRSEPSYKPATACMHITCSLFSHCGTWRMRQAPSPGTCYTLEQTQACSFIIFICFPISQCHHILPAGLTQANKTPAFTHLAPVPNSLRATSASQTTVCC